MSTSFRKDACISLPALVGVLALAFLSCVPRTDAAASDPNQGWIEVRSPHFTVATNASERDGRHIASQFEQMRGMFHAAFTTFRVDTPQPIYIIAAKNEGTMKLLLTEEWEAKGHVHPAGMYQHGEDKDYVLLQVDAQGSNPFHVVYHEYTHALLHLNFSALPLWLDEGLADFFGNSTLGEKESRTGTVDANTIYFLQQNRLIPIDTLLQVDHTSKFYNEANRASVFYAESWALVHYLMMNPEARQRGLLAKFTAAWEKSENQVQAAQEAFGDLRRFADVIEGYAHQQTFMMGVIKTQLEDSSKEYSARHITGGEALALRGDFMAHAGRMDTAKPAVEEAVRLEAKSPFAHEALGYYLYRKGELDKADAEMKEALADGDTSFGAAYLHGMLLGRQAGTADTRKEALESLKKATELNPKFAPAFDMLAYVYGQSPDEQKQALEACVMAAKLDPAQHRYLFHYANLLVNNERDAEARRLVQKIGATADSPQEKAEAEELLVRIRQHEEWLAARKERSQGVVAVSEAAASSGTDIRVTGDAAAAPKAPVAQRLDSKTTMAVEGKVHGVDCEHAPEIVLSLDFSGSVLALHSANVGLAEVTAARGQSAMSMENCQEWVGRKVKAWFHMGSGEKYFGEITKLYFF
jgi:tetratricopeptide (TPR) repeat protein